MKPTLGLVMVWVSLGLGASFLLLGCPASAPGTAVPSAAPEPRADASSPGSAAAQQTRPSGSHPVELTDANFEDVIVTGEAAALVDFWATWCPPCREQGPIVEAIAARYGDRVVVAKVDVDAADHTAAKFSIEAIPTLILFRDGKEVKRIIGLSDEQKLSDAIESTLLQ